MQRLGLYSLMGILVFALVFTLLPSGSNPQKNTDSVLEGVNLTLYPAHDTDAIWSFVADEVSSDPITGITNLSKLESGKRLIREKKSGKYTGKTTLDATIQAPSLSIDSQDNISTSTAKITLVKQCAEIKLYGTKKEPVNIEQGVGFSAPKAELDSPSLTGHVARLRMTFNFFVEDSDPEGSSFGWNPDSKETCKDGKRVSI